MFQYFVLYAIKIARINSLMPTPFTDFKLEQLRALFPHTEKQHTYLNHAAISPLSVPVVEALENFIDSRHVGEIMTLDDDLDALEDTKAALSELINADSLDRIAWTPNTSFGLQAIADTFAWQAGDEILLNTMEFPSNVYPFRNYEKEGVHVRQIDASNGIISLDKIEAAITPKTRMLSISAVQFLSGYKADLAEIGALCKKHDIAFIVDAIQALGVSPIDVQKMQIDALSCGSHKWLMAPVGLGFLYVSEEFQSKLKEKYYGWFSVEEPWEMLNHEQTLASTANRFESGALNIAAVHGLQASLQLINQVGIQNINQHVGYLLDLLVEGVWDLPVKTFTTSEKKNRAGIMTLEISNKIPEDVVTQELKKEQITVSFREGKLRIAPHFYNSAHEIMHISNVLRYILGKANR